MNLKALDLINYCQMVCIQIRLLFLAVTCPIFASSAYLDGSISSGYALFFKLHLFMDFQ